jgi:hypothetical protein
LLVAYIFFKTPCKSPSVVNSYYCWNVTNSEIKLEEAAVLHYTYTKFSDLTSRRDRCGCKPTKEDVKRCFMLDFDRAVSKLLNLLQATVRFFCRCFLCTSIFALPVYLFFASLCQW